TFHLHSRLPKLKEGKRGVRFILIPLNHPDSCRLVRYFKPDFVTAPPACVIEKHFSEGTVRTGVMLGVMSSLLPVLLAAAGVPLTDRRRWNMSEDHISVIHYPQPNANGVLQAFNIPIVNTVKTNEGSQEGSVAFPGQRHRIGATARTKINERSIL